MRLNKFIYTLIAVIFISTSNVYAKNIKYNLSAQHGPELKSADFPVRYKYEKTTGRKWKDTTYSQREAFLTDWHKQLAIKQLKSKQEAINKLKAQKELAKQKQELNRATRQELRNKNAAKRNEKRAVSTKTRNFKHKVNQQKIKLRRLHR